MKYTKRFTLLLLAALISIPLFVVHGAGGRIEGKIADPKGAAIAGATVTATNQATKHDFSAVTDAQGRYKIEGLPAGTYNLSVVASGFKDGRGEVKVSDDSATPLDLRLEIAPVEAQVKVPTGAQKGNLDPIYQNLRQLAKTDP